MFVASEESSLLLGWVYVLARYFACLFGELSSGPAQREDSRISEDSRPQNFEAQSGFYLLISLYIPLGLDLKVSFWVEIPESSNVSNF